MRIVPAPAPAPTPETEAREASGLTTRLILTYVEREGGRSAVRRVLEHCGLEDREEELRDEHAWFDDRVRIRLFEAASEVLDDPEAARRIGEAALDLNVGQGLKLALRALGSPRVLYSNAPRANTKFNLVHELKLLDLGERQARISNVPLPPAEWHPSSCQYNVGLLSCAPCLFGEPPARVSHPLCIGHGADVCVYEVQWTDRGRSNRRIAAWGGVSAAGVLATALLAPAALPVAGAAALAGGLGAAAAGAATARRRRLLEAELRQDRDAAALLMTSLGDLVSELRLEEVLEKITGNARSAVGGAELALLLHEPAGMRCQSSSGLPADTVASLERWAAQSPRLLEEPVLVDDLAKVEPLARLPEHPDLPLGSLCSAPLTYREGHLGVLVALAGAPEGFLPRDAELLRSYASQAAIALTNARLYEAQEALATRDALTGLLNHREFHETLGRELERCRRYGGELSVVLLDLDEFKLVNDTSGHAAGDRVLREVAEALRSTCRTSDLAFRIGGDELALVLPATGRREALVAARQAAEAAGAVDRRVTVSYGVAGWPDSATSKDGLLAQADEELYAMKRGGTGASRAGRREPRPRSPRDGESQRTKLAVASRLAAKLAPLFHPREIAATAVEELHLGLGFPGAAVCRLEANGELRPLAWSGRVAERESRRGFSEDGALARAARSGEPVLVPDCRKGPSLFGAGGRPGSTLAAPIRAGGELWGALGLEHSEPGSFDADEVVFVDMVATKLGAAVHRGALFGELEGTFMTTLAVLSDALEAKDAYTAAHAREVAELTERVGVGVGMEGEELRNLRYAALLHDIGKIGISTEVLRKPGPLSPEEMTEVKTHTEIGAEMLRRIPFFAEVHPLVRSAHERWDGDGYPDGLRGEEIPLGARIISACDALHAMTSDRPYGAARPLDEALEEMRRNSGTQFDPRVVAVLLEAVEERRPAISAA